MKVSVLILAYNHEKYIAQAIESALEQEVNFDVEIVVAEDCSTDSTRRIVLDYQEKYPKVIRALLRAQNLGATGNFIQAYTECRGEYIALLDGNDFWTDDNKLRKQVEFLDGNKDCSVCFHNVGIIYEGTNKPTHPYHVPIPLNEFNAPVPKRISHLVDIIETNFIQNCSVIFRNWLIKDFPSWLNESTQVGWALHILNAQYGNIGYIDEIMASRRVQPDKYASSLSGEAIIHETITMLSYIDKILNGNYSDIISNRIVYYYTKLAESFTNEGMNFLQNQDFQSALTRFEKAVEYSERAGQAAPGLNYARAVCLLQLKKYEESLEAAKKELSIDAANKNAKDLYKRLEKQLHGLFEPEVTASEESLEKLTQPHQKKDEDRQSLDSKKIIEVSIIILASNNGGSTGKCLDSIFNNSGANYSFEIILIEDGDSHITIGEFDNYRSINQGFKLIRNEKNIGLAASFNKGISASRGAFVVLLYNDTLVIEGWLDILIKEADSDENIGITGCLMLFPGTELIRHSGIKIANMEGKAVPYFADMLKSLDSTPEARISKDMQAVGGACMLIKKNIFEKIGLLDEDFKFGFEDVDFCIRAVLADFRVRFCAECIVFNGNLKSLQYRKHEKENIEKFNNKWGKTIVFDESEEESKINLWELWARLELQENPDDAVNISILLNIARTRGDKAEEAEWEKRLNEINRKKFRENIDVSIVIPTYNNLQNTKDCIESIRQHSQDCFYEIIAIDNGSCDGTVEYLEKEAKDNLDFSVIFNDKNLGFAIACNQGIKAASARYILLLNNDIIATNGWLSALLDEIRAGDRVGAVGAMLLYPDSEIIQHLWVTIGTEDGRTLAPYHAFQYAKLNDVPDARQSRDCSAITGACMLLNRELIDLIGLPDEEYINGLEDIDYCFRIREAGYKIKYCAKSKLYHYESKTPERHAHNIQNWQRLNKKWLGRIAFDETQAETNSAVAAMKAGKQALTEPGKDKTIVQPAESLFSQLPKEIDFSIIIPVHNNLDYTRNCLEGIWKIKGLNKIEIIIINNASTDSTGAYLESLGAQVKVITNSRNENYARINNQGASLATGKYLIFLNNDTFPFAGWLDALKKEFDEHDNTGIQGAKLLFENGTIQHAGMIFGKRSSRPEEPYHAYLKADPTMPFVNRRRKVQFVTGACLAVRKELFEQIGGFDEEYIFGWEDSDLCMKAASKGKNIIYNHEAVLYHYESKTKLLRQAAGDDLMDVDSPRELRNRERFFKKWGHLVRRDADDFYDEDGFRLEEYRLIQKYAVQEKQEELPIIPEKENKTDLRILFTMYGWNESGGGTVFPRNVATALASEGIHIAVFYAAGAHPQVSEPYYLEETIDEGVKLYGVFNRPTVFLDAQNPLRETADEQVCSLFVEVLDKEKPDVVHFHNFLGLSFTIAKEAKRRNIPTLYTPHNYHLIDPELYMFHRDLSLWKSVDFFENSGLAALFPQKEHEYRARIEAARNLIKNDIDYTLAVSYKSAEFLLEFGADPDKLTIVHQANKIVNELKDTVRNNPENIHKPLRIGFIGGVMPHKGLHILVGAVQMLDPRRAELWIYGFVGQDYKTLLDKMDSKKIINWKGEYSHKDLPAIAAELDLLVVPSVWEDCAPLVILEGLAMGLPVIGARIGGIPDFIIENENGRLYQYDSSDELAYILQEFVYAPEELIRLRKNVKLSFGFRTYLEHIINIYTKLASGEKPDAESLALYFNNKQIDYKRKYKIAKEYEASENINKLKFVQYSPGIFSNKRASGRLPEPLPVPLRLNLGCGNDIRDGFVNIDLFGDDPRVVGMDVRKLELPDDSANTILASDILEHFSHRETDKILAEWARVLKPGGELIIRCPSLNLQTKAYKNGVWDADMTSYMIFGGQTNPGDYHCTAFDEKSIKAHLQKAGLEVVEFVEWDLLQDKGYINLNMTVRARKPARTVNDTAGTSKSGFEKIKKMEQTSQSKESRMKSIKNKGPESVFGVFDFGNVEEKDREQAVENAKPETQQPQPKLNIVWEGSQFVYHSLALINREHCSNLIDSGVAELTIIPYENDMFEAEGNPKYEKLKAHDIRYKSDVSKETAKLPYVWIRHQWPPKSEPPKGAKWIIMQPWEYTALRQDFVDIFNQADELWTPSTFSRQSFINSGIDFNKVQVVPNGIDPELFTPNGGKYIIPTKKKLKLLYVGGTIYRKGIDILLSAFLKAFTSDDDICLVIKDMGGDSFYKGQTAKEKILQLKNQQKVPEIHYNDEYMTEEQIANLYRSCDVCINPYRGEGFSLPTLEAMACGLPVIVTDGGATDDFVDESVGWKIKSSRRSIGTVLDGKPLATEAFLLEPDLNDLVYLMKRIYLNPSSIFGKGIIGSLKARTLWTWKRSTVKLLSRLDALYGTSLAKESEKTLREIKDGIVILGEAYVEFLKGNEEEAGGLYESAINSRILPEMLMLHALNALALINTNKGNYDVSLELINKAEALSKGFPDNLYAESRLHFEKKEFDASLEALTALFDNWEAYKFETMLNLALDDLLCDTADCMYELNDIENAHKLYTEALKFNTENPFACYGAARCFLAADAKPDARQMLEWAVKLKPDFSAAEQLLDSID